MTSTAPIDRACLVVNGGSRTGARMFAPAQAALADHGVSVERSASVQHPADIPAFVDDALDAGCRLVVVGGGDGTVGSVAGVLARRSEAPRPVLGVLPLGTANDFARTLSIPTDLAAAAAVLASGKVVDVDLGWANDRPFVNLASVGLSVGAARALRPAMKRLLRGLSYPVSVAVAWRRHVPFGARLTFPDGDAETIEVGDVLQVAVGNGRYYGGGHTIAPHADIDDHAFDVYAIKTGRLRDHVSLARLVRDGTVIEHDDVRHVVTQRLRLETSTPEAVNLDGEVVAETPTDFTVQANAFEVVVPQHVTHVRHEGAPV